MRLGLISDIHANRVALEAVVADGRAAGVEQWWALGDLVAIGPQPVETLELLTALPGIAVLAGNTERYVLTNDRPPPSPADVVADPSRLGVFWEVAASFAWTAGAMAASGWIDWLRDLPLELRTDLPDGTRLLGVHATPGRDDGIGISADASDDALLDLLDGCDADLVCGGHTHRPVDRRVGGIRAVNLGSVANPLPGDARASYVVLSADRSSTAVEHRRVAYDVDRFLATVRRSGHPAAGYIGAFVGGGVSGLGERGSRSGSSGP